MTEPGADRGLGPDAPEGLPYHLIQLSGRPGWWRQAVGILLMIAWLALFAFLVVSIPFAIWYAVHGNDVADSISALADAADPTPTSLAFIDVVLATLIPVAILLSWLLHRIGPRWLLSVVGRIRWRWLLACLGAAVVALIATVVVGAVTPQQCDDTSGQAQLTHTTVAYLVVILVLTPFQASGEEFMFRGYLTQCVGALSRRVWVPVVLTGLVFGMFHGLGQPLPVFLSRFAFGLVAGYLVIRTGGLEAGIAMHTLNNWLSLALAAIYDQVGASLDPTCNSWWSLPATLTQSLVYLALVVLLCRRMGVVNTTDARVLEAPSSRV
jgi:membrane protease YdiL (CAAX protease family)